jgi:hypothetical protein
LGRWPKQAPYSAEKPDEKSRSFRERTRFRKRRINDTDTKSAYGKQGGISAPERRSRTKIRVVRWVDGRTVHQHNPHFVDGRRAAS